VAVQRLSNSGRSGFSYKSLIAGITPLPSVPTIGAATAVNFSSVNVAFTAPGAYAGSTYTATSSPGGLTGTSATSPILVTGLSESTAYTFTVTATNATGTSGASAASDAVTTPSGDLGVMYPIQMVSVGAAGASTISFTSIPSTYTHLQVRFMNFGQSSTAQYFRLNGDAGSNYARHLLVGTGSSVAAYAGSSQTELWPISGINTSSFPAVGIIDILDYKNTSKYKTTRTFGGIDNNGGATNNEIALSSGLWMNTNSVTSITFFPLSGNFTQYSTFALYGIKGA
jgi:hypothetical protein